ncbi:MAG: hypothetical protein IH964_13560 [Candidatus Dadabacteria bacterium]|nr:hypothetical protein [Candidatus Dadabacteria bacterium]
MSKRNEIIKNLHRTLKELEREMDYQWLKNYAQNLKQKEYLNGKEIQRLQGATARLKGLEADRRSISLGLTPFIPYDKRRNEHKEMIQGSYISWDRSVCLFDKE